MLRYHSAPSGNWLIAAAEGRVLALRANDDEAAVERVWATVSLPVQAVLDELTSGGLSSTPPFALLEYSGELATGTADVHAIVRGEASIAAVVAGESIQVDGASATTWVERSFEGVQSLDIVFGADAPASATLPLVHGVVAAARVTLAQGVAHAVAVPAAAPKPAASTAAAAPAPAAAAPATQHVAPPVTPIVAPVSTDIEDATIAEFTLTSARGTTPEPPADAGEPAADEAEAAPDFGYDSLFEETMVRSIEEAAVRPEEEDEHAEPSDIAAADSKGDHDGMTMMGADFAALRAARKNGGAAPAASAPPVSTHEYRLELSSGGTEPLTGTVLVGRAPSVSKVSGGQIPRLVTLTGSDDISRNHAQFAIEGDTVVVTDLHSRNGTSVILPGRAPQLLRAGEPTSVLADTVVDLGGGVTITVREV